MINTELNALIINCLTHDERSKRKLVHFFTPKVAGICRRYISNKSDIEDLVQESFIKFFINLEKYDPNKGEIGAWLYKITINTVFKHLRQQQVFFFVDVTTLVDVEEVTFTSEEYIDNLQMNDLMGFIDSLPSGMRAVFNMYMIEGYKHKEIAETLNITEGASKAHLNKARKQLVELIEKHTS